MKDFKNEKDVKESDEATQREGRTLRIELGRTPIYILTTKYFDGYAHWVPIGGKKMRIICGGGLAGKGYDTDNCTLCKITYDLYMKAKVYEKKGIEEKADKIRQKGNDLRARYELYMQIAKGEMVYVGKDENGKKKYKPDFKDADVGTLCLSEKQRQDMKALAGSPKYPFIENLTDLLERVVILDKAKRGDASYPTIEWHPSKSKIKLDFEHEKFDCEEDFKVDKKTIHQATKALLSGGKPPVEYEEEKDEEEEETEEVIEDEDYIEDTTEEEGGEEDDEEPDSGEEKGEAEENSDDEEIEEKRPTKTKGKKGSSSRSSKSEGKESDEADSENEPFLSDLDYFAEDFDEPKGKGSSDDSEEDYEDADSVSRGKSKKGGLRKNRSRDEEVEPKKRKYKKSNVKEVKRMGRPKGSKNKSESEPKTEKKSNAKSKAKVPAKKNKKAPSKTEF